MQMSIGEQWAVCYNVPYISGHIERPMIVPRVVNIIIINNKIKLKYLEIWL